MLRLSLVIAILATVSGQRISPSLPAPLTDYWIPTGWSYHNVATLGPSPKTVTSAVSKSLLDLEVCRPQLREQLLAFVDRFAREALICWVGLLSPNCVP